MKFVSFSVLIALVGDNALAFVLFILMKNDFFSLLQHCVFAKNEQKSLLEYLLREALSE